MREPEEHQTDMETAGGARPVIMTILGTRPEVVKLAPVVHALQAHDYLRPLICATAQHRDMLDTALEIFGIEPDVDLDLMQPDQQLHELTGRILEAVTYTLRTTQPDFVLVQGDTTTAMAAAMAAFYEQIPVGHVEAGLRTGDLANPFPEEMNRKVVTAMATLHFAPTARARAALVNEGVPEERIVLTGNTVVDALLHTLQSASPPHDLSRRRILVTAHRRESFGAPFDALCQGLRLIATRNPQVELLYPVHRNPTVRESVDRHLSDLPNVRLIEPLDYRDFVLAMRDSYLILTDSGGIQEEAPTLGKPVLVMRDTTERPEAVQAGAARLVGTDPQRIVAECERLLNDTAFYTRMASIPNPFGDGRAGGRIVRAIAQWFQGKLEDRSPATWTA